MSKNPVDPFKEQRKLKRLIDDAADGSIQKFLEVEQKRRALFNQLEIGRATRVIAATVREQEHTLLSYQNNALEQYIDAEDARRKAFNVESLASAKAFQVNIFSNINTLIGPFTELSKQIRESIEPFTKLSAQIRELAVLNRIAELQSAFVKFSASINSQIETSSRSMSSMHSFAREISASLSVQSALAQQIRRISKQVAYLDGAILTDGIRKSAVWEAMQDTYGFSNEISVSQALFEVGTKLDEPSEERKSFGIGRAWQLVQFLWIVYSFYAAIAGWGDYTEQDRARDEMTANVAERIEIRQHMNDLEAAIAQASALAEMKRINALPRAFVREAANIRVAPMQKGKRVARLDANTMLAIEEENGPWLRVIYADTLTKELAEGWVWGGSVEHLASN